MPGREVIAALAGAADVTLRLNAVVHQSIHPGWLPTTVFGTVSASMAAARALGLDEEGLANAAGFGYAQSHGNRQALARRHGRQAAAARLQRAGRRTFCRAGANRRHRPQANRRGSGRHHRTVRRRQRATRTRSREDLGETFHVSRVGMKPYPSCRVSHPHISAALEARERLGLIQRARRRKRRGMGHAHRPFDDRPAVPDQGESPGGRAIQRTVDDGVLIA